MAQGVRSQLRGLSLLAVTVTAAAVGILTYSFHLTEWLQRPSVDARFSLRGTRPAPPGVVVVAIDEQSIGNLPRYPFSRALEGRVLERLKKAGARVIVEDIAFDRPTTERADFALLEAARRSAPVVFGTSLIEPGGQTEVLGGNANLASIGAVPAAARLQVDSDGVLRHTSAASEGLPSIASAVATLSGRAAVIPRLKGGWIDYPGPPGTFGRLSFVSVLHGDFNPAAVRGKVAVIGATAAVLQDLHATSVGAPMPGPEVQAAAVATALADMPLRSPSGAVTVLLIVLLGLALPAVALRAGTVIVAVVAAALLAGWCLANVLTFNNGTVLDFSDPLAALVVAGAGTVLLGMWADGRERRRLRERFAEGEKATVEQVLHGHGGQALSPDSVVAGYRLEAMLERGGMGVVYRAVQLALDRPVALKLIATEYAHDPDFRERFRRESRMAAAVEHANVIPVYEAGEDDGLLFIAMRLVDGFDLSQLLHRCAPLPQGQTARLGGEIAAALDAAHAHGLVHRDVKPANILLSADQPPHAYLTDFGLARHLAGANRITSPGGLVGTVDYMSPEQINGEAAGSAADIYSLTAVLYHCLAGEIPYPRESAAAAMWAHVSAAPPSLSDRCPELARDVDDVIARGMAREPSARYGTAAELAAALVEALGVSDVEADASRANPVLHEGPLSVRPAGTLVREQP
jgi:CHASE2 domain-containing sensor protein